MSSKILVPFDATPQSEAALSFAAEEWPTASLTLLYVIDPVALGLGRGGLPSDSEAWYESARRTARSELESARELVDDTVDTVDDRIEVGSPARTIVDAAEGPHDHIVLGSHGREGVSRILLGSVAEAVVRRSPVPVTVVR